MARIKNQPCVYCQKRQTTTADHVPPKCLFLPPRPTRLITVPACLQCNNSFQLDDEYFRLAVAGVASPDTPWHRLWQHKVMGSTFRRSPKLLADVLTRTHEIGAEAERRLPLSGRQYLILDGGRVSRVLHRIVRGLMWHHYRWLPGMKIACAVIPGMNLEDLQDVIAKLNCESVGSGAFTYYHAGEPRDPPKKLFPRVVRRFHD